MVSLLQRGEQCLSPAKLLLVLTASAGEHRVSGSVWGWFVQTGENSSHPFFSLKHFTCIKSIKNKFNSNQS